MPTTLNTPQNLTLQLIRAAGNWNNFHGEKIASDLEAQSSLWTAAYITTMAQGSSGIGIESKVNLLPLRQLAEGYLSPDTLFILPTPGAHDALQALVLRWNPDEISWWSLDFVKKAMRVSNRSPAKQLFSDEDRAVMYIWWD